MSQLITCLIIITNHITNIESILYININPFVQQIYFIILYQIFYSMKLTQQIQIVRDQRYHRLIRMLTTFQTTNQDKKSLQQMKNDTEFDIALKFKKCKTNKSYKFPVKIVSEQPATIEQLQLDSKSNIWYDLLYQITVNNTQYQQKYSLIQKIQTLASINKQEIKNENSILINEQKNSNRFTKKQIKKNQQRCNLRKREIFQKSCTIQKIQSTDRENKKKSYHHSKTQRTYNNNIYFKSNKPYYPKNQICQKSSEQKIKTISNNLSKTEELLHRRRCIKLKIPTQELMTIQMKSSRIQRNQRILTEQNQSNKIKLKKINNGGYEKAEYVFSGLINKINLQKTIC